MPQRVRDNLSHRSRTGLPILLLVLTTITGVSAPALASQQSVNEWCPVMTEEKADPAITVEHLGKTVALCCQRCLTKFQADPERYLSRLPQFAKPSPQDTADAQSSGQPASAHSTPVDVTTIEKQRDRAGTPTGGSQDRLPWLARLHPVIVHFPLAGIPLAMLAFLVWTVTGRDAFAKADAVPLLTASVAAAAAVVTGNMAYDAMQFGEALHRIAERHEWSATASMVLAIALSVLRIWRWNRLTGPWRWAYGLGLLAACALLAITGFWGGSLVFGPDHLSL